MLIYKATFPNKKSYIGQTIRYFYYRKANHIYSSFHSSAPDYNVIFHKAIRKYGIENIKWEILENKIDNKKLLNEKEIFYIKKYNTLIPNGYNIEKGGKSKSGYILSEETKEKMRKAKLGKKHTEETKRKISKNHADFSGKNHPLYGKHLSEEHKKIIRNVHKGKCFMSKKYLKKLSERMKKFKHTKESKLKISLSLKGKKFTKEHRKRLKEAWIKRRINIIKDKKI